MEHPFTSDLDLTLTSIRQRGWVTVLLRPRSKRPVGTRWVTTSDIDRVRGHLRGGGNLGLVCGPDSGVAVPDFDQPAAADLMFRALGPLPRWVQSRPGRFHCYVQWEPALPAKLRWEGQVVGDLQRGPDRSGQAGLQQVVIPPSIHPATGTPYQWLVDPVTEPLRPFPSAWIGHVNSHVTVTKESVVTSRVTRTIPPSCLPHLLQIALRQPGSHLRSDRVKFQCPACREEGHDRHQDNAVVFFSGRWGCALSPAHWQAIGMELGALWRDGIRFTTEVRPWH